MAALRRLGTAVDGNFQGPAGGMVPRSPRLLASNGSAPRSPAAGGRREEEAASGGGGPGLAALRPTPAKPPLGSGKIKKLFSAPGAGGGKPRKRAPLWQAALFVSVAIHAGLFVLHPYVNSAAPPHRHHHPQEPQACLTHPEAAGSDGGRRRATQEKAWAAGAPSTGKPAVTPESVINLDQ